MSTTCGKNGNKDFMLPSSSMKSRQEGPEFTAASVATVPGWPKNFSISYISQSHSIGASSNQLTKTQNWLLDTVPCATKQTISTAGLGTSISKTGCGFTVLHLGNCGLQSNTSQISSAYLCKFQYHLRIYLVTLNVYYNSLENTLLCPMGPTITTCSKHLCQLPQLKLKVFFQS